MGGALASGEIQPVLVDTISDALAPERQQALRFGLNNVIARRHANRQGVAAGVGHHAAF